MSNTQYETQSIEDLKKELHRVYKESSVKIKNEIKKTNETYNHALEDFNRNLKNDEKFKFNESFTKIQEKIKLINELIEKLKKIKPSKKWEVKLPKVIFGQHLTMQPKHNSAKTDYQPGDNSTVQKHIEYLTYLKKILETKVIKDVKIMNLFNAVMDNTNEIVDAINKIKAIMDNKEEGDKKKRIQTANASYQHEPV